jgi:hypothetical protein
MKKTICRACERRAFSKPVMAFLLLGASVASAGARTTADPQKRGEYSPKAKAYIYWTNSVDGSLGRASISGKGANENFITLGTTSTGRAPMEDKRQRLRAPRSTARM